ISPPSTKAPSISASSAIWCCGRAHRRFRSASSRGDMNDAETVMAHCDELAAFTEEPGRITRPYASESLRRAQETVIAWMREAGMAVTRDNVGNLRARYDGTGRSTLLLGSHLDSVRNAGRYDGPLGVMVAIAAVQRLHDSKHRMSSEERRVGKGERSGWGSA